MVKYKQKVVGKDMEMTGISRGAYSFKCLDLIIGEEDEVRVVDKLVDTIIESKEIKKYIDRKDKLKDGRPEYGYATMLKLLVYSYRRGIRSGRKIEDICKYDERYQWLMNELKPDANTINDFRQKNKELIDEAFYEANRIYIKLGIIKPRIVGQDGYKTRANNSKEKNYTVNKLMDRIKREEGKIELTKEEITQLKEEQKKVEKYLKEVEKEEELERIEDEIEKQTKKLEELQEFIERHTSKKKQIIKQCKKHKRLLKKLERREETQISLTDKDSRLMKNNGKYDVAYNTQAVVDVESHVTLGFDTDNNPADIGSMEKVMKKTKKKLKLDNEVLTNITDKGYQSMEDMKNCLEIGVIPQVTPNNDEKERVIITEYEENKISEKERKSTKPKNIKKCLRAGVIPECYKDVIKDIKVEIREKRKYQKKLEEETKTSEEIREEAIQRGIFIRDRKLGVVYCPMGEVLGKKSERKGGKIRYANKLGCKRCKAPCTKSKYKEVEFIKNQRELIPKGKKEKREKTITTKEIQKKVLITLKIDQELLKKRMGTCELWITIVVLICAGRKE